MDIAVTDLLANMFIKQMSHKREYDKIYDAKGIRTLSPDDYGNLDLPEVQAELRSTAGFMVEELYEAIGLLKNKPWKQSMRHTDRAEFNEEIADFWHFVIEFMIVAGMGPDVIASEYFGKAETNDNRRSNGY